MKTISVIIPCYNHAATIGRCLESIFAQTIAPFEVIVVDDGSTDALDAALASFLGKIKLVRQANSGGPAARNRGFRESTGDLVMFCDADAFLRPDALEKLEFALESEPEAAYAYASFRFGWKKFPLGPFDPERLKKHNYIHTGSLIRREKFPGFDETLKRFQDWDLWLTMLERGDAGVWVPELLVHVHVSSKRGGISNWLPKLMYRLPWNLLGWKPKRVAEYEAAAAIIRKKHRLA